MNFTKKKFFHIFRKIFTFEMKNKNQKPSMKVTHTKESIGVKDFFLVSYPRSGNTWVRFILANLFFPYETITFKNIHQYSPELGKLALCKNSDQFPRIIKSHDTYNPSFSKIIYLLRDGRDVYISFFHYYSNRLLDNNVSLSSFINNPPDNYCLWSEHINSWLNNSSRISLLLIKYEDLILDTFIEIRKIIDFLGIDRKDKEIYDAIQKSSFSNMKQIELKYGRGKFKSGPDVFVRGGKVGEWKKYFTNKDKLIFKNNDNTALLKFGYESSPDW